jgi:hypothetical protein
MLGYRFNKTTHHQWIVSAGNTKESAEICSREFPPLAFKILNKLLLLLLLLSCRERRK